MWAKNYERCVSCGTVDIRHLARGLCARCYYRATEERHRSKDRKRGLASKILTKQCLEEEYLNKKRSASEIARGAHCGRQYVYKRIIEYKLPIRSKAIARALALDRGKITNTRRTKFGKSESFVLKKRVVNESFFSSWSKEMAWVLGVVYTDGSIDPGRQENTLRPISVTTAKLSIGQKEPELLLKLIRLMESNAKLITVTGGTMVLQIYSNKIYRDLVDIGLRPHKSLDMQFPNIPKAYLSHFIRGCWDGDGSIGFYENKYRARFFCGSLSFIERFVKCLDMAGLPHRNIAVRYTKRKNPFYNISFTGKKIVKLYEFLYKDADPSCYLERKHELFQSAYNKYEDEAIATKGEQLKLHLK